MDTESIKDQILNILKKIAPEVSRSQLDEHSKLRDQVDLDSIDYLRFLKDISTFFKITIMESDYEKIQNINSLIHYIEKAKSLET